jgi:hypothetical protein
VSGFREAARALAGAEKEWISVEAAGQWLVAKYPDQTPQRFRCKTWQHALQESSLFDLRHERKGGRRVICFNERAKPKIRDRSEWTWEFDDSGALIHKP